MHALYNARSADKIIFYKDCTIFYIVICDRVLGFIPIKMSFKENRFFEDENEKKTKHFYTFHPSFQYSKQSILSIC